MKPRHLFGLIPLCAIALLGGCLLEYAPSGPSRSTNTWLLGVWEAQEEDGKTYRAIVTPVASDRMEIIYTEKNRGGKVVRSGTFPAWISKVGHAHLLVIQAQTEPAPGYLVLGYQFLQPLKVRVREVTLDPPKPFTSSFRVRVQIRRQFARGELFRGKQLLWHKTGEVYWAPEGNPADHTFEPTRNLPPRIERIEEVE